MVGRRVPHPLSTKFHDDNEPPAKKLKTFDSTDAEDSRDVSENEDLPPTPRRFRDEIPDSDEEVGSGDDEVSAPQRPTELESALPPVKTDKEAIEEYEAMRAAEDVPDDLKHRLFKRDWTKGKSSIYVDAFNLALETVLEDEGHLFDEKEMEVFSQWRTLEYEAQYL
jgi:Fanconi-associated nuclease 1